jgi:hypothetical protein
MNLRDKYRNITKLNDRYVPRAFLPSPSDLDYRRGYIIRYFIQQANDDKSPIFEINDSDVEAVNGSNFYDLVKIRWRIRGPLDTIYKEDGSIKDIGVKKSNQKSIKFASSGKMPNLKKYLGSLTQFYKK